MQKSADLLPDWVRNAVFYEIYPQSFLDTNGDGIGDLEGVRQKLDYVSSLGATAIWLNPFYRSPMRDAGYDVADFYAVDPRYGTKEDLRQIFAEARAKGLRIIIDLVPGHTAQEHPWFQESAKRHATRPFRNWYIWTESAWDDGGSPWKEKMVHGYSSRDGNYLINFFWSQPALNFGFAEPEADKPWQLPTTHEDVQALWREMRAIMRHWLELGASGFRVDMADSIIRNDPGKKEIRRFWRETREELEKDFPEFFIVAEGHPSNLLDGSGFHSAFLHWAAGYWQLFRRNETRSQTGEIVQAPPFFERSGEGDFRPYLKTWKEQYEKTREGGVITVPLGNHDLPRVGARQSTVELEMMYAFVTAWPGIPFIYNGDEIGLPQQTTDNPIHEGHYPPRNGARTPMQWNRNENFGFSTCHPTSLYLPVDSDPESPNVEDAEADQDSLLHRYRKLNALYRKEAALAADAPVEILTEGAPGEPLVFTRGNKDNRLLCFLAPKEGAVHWSLPNSLGKLGERIAGSGQLEISAGALTGEGPAWAYYRVG